MWNSKLVKNIKQLEEKVKQLECGARTGHNYIFVKPVCGGFIFKCLFCEHEIHKYVGELNGGEKEYFTSLGYIWKEDKKKSI